MYAIVKDRGKQFKVKKGETLLIDRMDVEAGKGISFDEVTFYTDHDRTLVGAPALENVSVKADVLGEEKGTKVLVFKMKRRKRYRRKTGHRQRYTKVRITDISVT